MAYASISLDVLDICRSFFQESGVNAFSYSRLYDDGTRCELWSDAAAFDHTFFKACYIVGAYTPPFFSKNERYSLLDKKIETYPKDLRDRYRNQLADQREYFNHDHCFAILNPKKDFFEYFIFYCARNNNMAINFYINNKDKLEKFSAYFLHKSEKLVLRADQHRIQNHTIYPENNFPSTMTPQIDMTAREKDVARLLVMGATIKEVGIALNISPRTVECHVEKMKAKLDCPRKSLLIQKLHLRESWID